MFIVSIDIPSAFLFTYFQFEQMRWTQVTRHKPLLDLSKSCSGDLYSDSGP